MSVSFPEIYEQVKAQLGKTRRIPFGVINRRDVERFAFAVDDPNPLFFDDAFARAHGYSSAIAPPLYLSSVLGWESGPPQDSLSPDGNPSGDETALPVGGLRVMGGGQELEFHRPVTAGLEVVIEFSVTNVELKQGRSGPLLVIQLQKKFLTNDGALLVTCRENAIAR
jgi:acyl dehydratase